MEYMTIKETSKKWGLSERRIQEICVLKKIPGAFKFGREWAIPAEAERPFDARKRQNDKMQQS